MCVTHRFEQSLRRVTKDERETEDDSRKRNKRCKSIASVEDEQTDEEEDQGDYGKHDRVELRHSGAYVLDCNFEYPSQLPVVATRTFKLAVNAFRSR